MKVTTSRQQKIAQVYDSDIWPLVPERAAELILRALPKRPGTVAFEAGCASGNLTFALAERLDDASRILAIDSSPALIDLAEAAKARHPAQGKVSFHVADPAPPLPVDDASYDLAVSNLALAETPDTKAAIADLGRCLKPGGRALVTLPLSGSWAEFLDLYGDVLTEQGKAEGLAALGLYRASMLAPEGAVSMMQSAGLTDVTVEVKRWEVLFKTAREFFYAPIIDLGPLATWKQIAGGHGDEMQDVFFFVKEAIEAYFSGTVFPVTMVVGCVVGTKPAAAVRPR